MQAYFAEQAVQLPLQKGDGVFFNPALMHAAGANVSKNIERMANLLQISSAFGKAMESLDQQRMQLSCYPYLLDMQLTALELAALATTLSDSYPFPSNLDRDAPVGGLRPLSGKDLLLQAIAEVWSAQRLAGELAQLQWRKRSH